MNMVVYKILIKVCLDITPVMTDILKIYFIILFLYGAAGLFMFGGLMNTSYIEKYEELTGEEIDEETLIFNFNDILNSFIFFFNANLAGEYMDALNTTLVLQKSQSDSNFKFLMVKLWFYSFMIITEFALLNVLIGFICGLLDVYTENNKEETEKEIE